METTKWADDSAKESVLIERLQTVQKLKSRNGHLTAEENPGENGVGGNNSNNHEGSINNSCRFKMEKQKMLLYRGC